MIRLSLKFRQLPSPAATSIICPLPSDKAEEKPLGWETCFHAVPNPIGMVSSHPPFFSALEPIPPSYQGRLMPEAIPQYFSGKPQSSRVVICLHGFTGVPYEVHPVARACADRGIDAVSVLLPGHGYQDPREQRRQLPKITMDGMFAAARKVIAQARQRYERVGIFGLSMGGAIALTMAAEGHVDVCAVAAPALRLPRDGEILIPLLSWLGFYLPSKSKDACHLPGYSFYHSHALRQLWHISRHARAQLPDITCPVIGVHSRSDKIIPAIATEWVEKQVSGPVEVTWFEECGHCMPLEANGEAVSTTLAAGLDRCL